MMRIIVKLMLGLIPHLWPFHLVGLFLLPLHFLDLVFAHRVLDYLKTLSRILKDMPSITGHTFEGLLKPLGLVLVRDADRSNISSLANQN